MNDQCNTVKDLRDDWENKIQTDSNTLPRRKVSGEARLNRLVRRLSFQKSASQSEETHDKLFKEPIYNTVDDLASTTYPNSSESSENLCFQDSLKPTISCPVLTINENSSVSPTTELSAHPSIMENDEKYDEDETEIVNLQYFSPKRIRSDSKLSSDRSICSYDDSDDDIDECDSKSLQSKLPQQMSTSEENHNIKYQDILKSIIDSEANYLECLKITEKFMKAIEVNLTTSDPVIPQEDFEVIFFKISELHEFHTELKASCKKQPCRWKGDHHIGHHFKMLSQKTNVYTEFLSNYPQALATFHKCIKLYPQFAELAGAIKMQTLKGDQKGQFLSLEDLLNKPVAKVQKSSLKHLIEHTSNDNPDLTDLTEALQIFNKFLHEFNQYQPSSHKLPMEQSERELVKNSLTVELSEGSRKLRHLFLFSDVLVCGKHKTTGKREDFTFLLKWFIPLDEVIITEEPEEEPKETKPANLVSLKTTASSLRDTIKQSERDLIWSQKKKFDGKNLDKLRRNLGQIEAQMVLALPHLLLQVSGKSRKTFSLFFSSEHERSLWLTEMKHLKEKLPPHTSQAHNMSRVELQTTITTCRKFLKTNMGSFLMRSPRDEPLLYGDLHLVLKNLNGLTAATDIFVVIEVDSYGHYFRKVKTRTIKDSIEPIWNDEFVIELEGSDNLRILVYEDTKGQGSILIGKAVLKLSRSWLGGLYNEQKIQMNDTLLTFLAKYLAFDETIRRVPTVSSNSLFKSSLGQTTRKEKRAVPFIITSLVQEVERRGITEVGIYRVNGSAIEMSKLKRVYESNPYEAEQLIKECDVHAVAGILKQYLRDLPECIFTLEAYNKLNEAYSIKDEKRRSRTFLHIFSRLPQNPNQTCVVFIIEHLVRVAQMEHQNKMTLDNLATVFGPTMLHPGPFDKKGVDILSSSTVDVMALSGVLQYFLSRSARGEAIQIR